MHFQIDKGTGYMYCYAPNHYCSNGAGKVMEHTYVMAESIGRMLYDNECVHHKDRNRTNNKLENLQLMTMSDHMKLHAIEDRGYQMYEISCKNCKTIFFDSDSARIYCTPECSKIGHRLFNPSVDELKTLVWAMPTSRVATMFGVSDVAISKRCKKFGIKKPPRGYWTNRSYKIIKRVDESSVIT